MRVNSKEYRIGMTKLEIVEDHGIGENLFSSNIWYYIIKKKILWRKEVLFIEFEDDIAVYISIKHTFGKIKK